MKIGERVDHQLTITAKAVDEGKRILKFSITDETSDRSNDVIEARGGDMENYLKNPVVLFAHNHKNLTVAKTIGLELNQARNRWEATVQFPKPEEISSTPSNPAEHVKFIDTLYLMYKGGYINAVSVGIIPKEFSARTETGKEGGNRITKWELLEFSAVPVPDNPNALRLARMATLEKSIEKKFLNQLKNKESGGEPMMTEKARKSGMEELHGHLQKCYKSLKEADACHKEAEASHKDAMDAHEKSMAAHKDAMFHHKNAMETFKSLKEDADDETGGEGGEGPAAPEGDSGKPDKKKDSAINFEALEKELNALKGVK